MRAVILAGGLGSRLRPYTVVLPKPLMPIGEYPIIEVVIRQLKLRGFNHVTLAVNHQADIIKAYFEDGSKWGLKIDYVLEKMPLGTMGPLSLIQDLPENFLVLNGDVLTDLNFDDFLQSHVKKNIVFSISGIARQEKIDYGVLLRSSSGDLTGFVEKPKNEYLVSMGVYALNREVVRHIPENQFFGFDDLMKLLLSIEERVSVEVFNGYWRDIGRPDDYELAIDEFEVRKRSILKL